MMRVDLVNGTMIVNSSIATSPTVLVTTITGGEDHDLTTAEQAEIVSKGGGTKNQSEQQQDDKDNKESETLVAATTKDQPTQIAGTADKKSLLGSPRSSKHKSTNKEKKKSTKSSKTKKTTRGEKKTSLGESKESVQSKIVAKQDYEIPTEGIFDNKKNLGSPSSKQHKSSAKQEGTKKSSSKPGKKKKTAGSDSKMNLSERQDSAQSFASATSEVKKVTKSESKASLSERQESAQSLSSTTKGKKAAISDSSKQSLSERQDSTESLISARKAKKPKKSGRARSLGERQDSGHSIKSLGKLKTLRNIERVTGLDERQESIQSTKSASKAKKTKRSESKQQSLGKVDSTYDSKLLSPEGKKKKKAGSSKTKKMKKGGASGIIDDHSKLAENSSELLGKKALERKDSTPPTLDEQNKISQGIPDHHDSQGSQKGLKDLTELIKSQCKNKQQEKGVVDKDNTLKTSAHCETKSDESKHSKKASSSVETNEESKGDKKRGKKQDKKKNTRQPDNGHVDAEEQSTTDKARRREEASNVDITEKTTGDKKEKVSMEIAQQSLSIVNVPDTPEEEEDSSLSSASEGNTACNQYCTNTDKTIATTATPAEDETGTAMEQHEKAGTAVEPPPPPDETLLEEAGQNSTTIGRASSQTEQLELNLESQVFSREKDDQIEQEKVYKQSDASVASDSDVSENPWSVGNDEDQEDAKCLDTVEAEATTPPDEAGLITSTVGTTVATLKQSGSKLQGALTTTAKFVGTKAQETSNLVGKKWHEEASTTGAKLDVALRTVANSVGQTAQGVHVSLPNFDIVSGNSLEEEENAGDEEELEGSDQSSDHDNRSEVSYTEDDSLSRKSDNDDDDLYLDDDDNDGINDDGVHAVDDACYKQCRPSLVTMIESAEVSMRKLNVDKLKMELSAQRAAFNIERESFAFTRESLEMQLHDEMQKTEELESLIQEGLLEAATVAGKGRESINSTITRQVDQTRENEALQTAIRRQRAETKMTLHGLEEKINDIKNSINSLHSSAHTAAGGDASTPANPMELELMQVRSKLAARDAVYEKQKKELAQLNISVTNMNLAYREEFGVDKLEEEFTCLKVRKAERECTFEEERRQKEIKLKQKDETIQFFMEEMVKMGAGRPSLPNEEDEAPILDSVVVGVYSLFGYGEKETATASESLCEGERIQNGPEQQGEVSGNGVHLLSSYRESREKSSNGTAQSEEKNADFHKGENGPTGGESVDWVGSLLPDITSSLNYWTSE